MGYKLALEKAGCKILAFEEFGCYQGTWLAFVEYEGEKGIVKGCYGSCSGCDAFQYEFGYGDEPTKLGDKYYKDYWGDNEITKDEYERLLDGKEEKLVKFGKSYLVGGLYNKAYFENKLANLKEDDWFDQEEKEQIEWAINQYWN